MKINSLIYSERLRVNSIRKTEFMRTKKIEERFYRNWTNTDDLVKSRIQIQETDLQILTERNINESWLKKRILCYRRDIQDYISRQPRFLTSLKPVSSELDAPAIIKLMTKASKVADVGPMAAVAGAIAQFLGRDLLKQGYGEIIIENGGDIFLKTKRCRCVGIFAGKSGFSRKLALKIEPGISPCGICTSSATVGHSLSLGKSDGAVILAKDAALADALATATCNLVDSRRDLNKAIEFAKNINGVLGAVIILGDELISWGVEFV